MKLPITIMSIFLLAGAINAEGGNDLKTEKDRVSYSIGMDIGGNLKSQGIDIDPEILAQGLVDTFKGENTKLTQEEFSEAMTNFQKKMMAKQAELQASSSSCAATRLSPCTKQASHERAFAQVAAILAAKGSP